MHVSTRPWTDWSAIEPIWRELWEASEPRTMFMSPEWVEAWLHSFGEALDPRLITIHDHSKVVGCCTLVSRRELMLGLPVDRVYLNTAGEAPADDLCVEYNDLLCRPDMADAVADALSHHLQSLRWDELVINGATPSPAMRRLRDCWGSERERTLTKHARYVDLEAVRGKNHTYLTALSANTREQVRRSKRWYEQSWGPLTVTVCDTTESAVAAFDEMIALHQECWTSRGEAGVFASPSFTATHRRLVERTATDRIHLVRISAGNHLVGILYNFVVGGRVAFYQSGFSYGTDNRQKPGLVSHASAIEHYVAAGFLEYDFMGRDSRYKRSLGPSSRERHWIIVEQRSRKMRLYARLRSLKRALQPLSRLPQATAANEG